MRFPDRRECFEALWAGFAACDREDSDCSSRIAKAGKILGIRILDHIIIGESEYFSFADAALIDQSPEAF